MFKKENRLVSGIKFTSASFSNIPQFVLKAKKNNLSVNRFGIIVSKKIDKRAVARNKIKRFFRNTLYRLNKKLALGHDILFIVKKGILEKEKKENQESIKKALKKEGILIDEKNNDFNN